MRTVYHEVENGNHEKVGKRGKKWEKVGNMRKYKDIWVTRGAVAEGIQDSRNFSVEVLFTVGK